ncbi:hypothetical protein F7R91_38195 [Streptomyces luteolifulvus]|uniref:Uncharacterized protein n=1 Tax=Streptomyces luteolifulvus TaxID=2615112 RepID=A0A6H9UPP3_9ACTN|nr:hypothetical protein F7R91_38195 [Streptomyces luteolifulvus]
MAFDAPQPRRVGDHRTAPAQDFADRLDLRVGEAMQFSRNFYAELITTAGKGATEVLIDPGGRGAILGFRQALRPLLDARAGGRRDSHARCATGGQDGHGTGGRVLTRQGVQGRE